MSPFLTQTATCCGRRSMQQLMSKFECMSIKSRRWSLCHLESRLTQALLFNSSASRVSEHRIHNAFQKSDSTAIFLKLNFSTNKDAQNKEEGDKQDGKEGSPEDDRRRNSLLLGFGVGVALAVMLMGRPSEDMDQGNSTTISWSQFVNEYLKKGEVELLVALKDTETVLVQLYSGALIQGKPVPRGQRIVLKTDTDKIEEKIRKAEEELGIPSNESVRIVWKDFRTQSAIISTVVLGIIAYAVFMTFRRFSISKALGNPFESMTNAKYVRGDKSSHAVSQIRFKDIAGLHEAKVEIKEYVEYLKDPARFQNLGARIPHGALLLGPPGCGKTLLAKAVAAESGVPFLVMAGTDFVEMIGGVGASRIRGLFKDARKLKPCIIYIDEIDALGRKRGDGSSGSSSGGESEQTLNQLLTEMDGMTDNSGVIMLASTNRADVLDQALLRPGRFDRHINIDLPTLIERKELFSMYLKKLTLEHKVGEFVDYLAQATPGMSGADIANVCNEAALHAAREANKTVGKLDLNYALDRILGGQAKRTNTISQQERKVVAYHECGHVLVGWMLEHTDALLKVTIVPRTGAALGFAQYMPTDKKLYSKEDLFQMMCVALGGRAAEAVVFNRITTGAQNDLEKVRQLAYNQIKRYGMGHSIGLMSFPSDGGDDFQVKPYSKHFQQMMDMEAQQMVASAYKTAEKILTKHRDKLNKISDLLLTNEEMTYDEVKAAIGPPPFGDKKLVDMLEVPA